MEDTQQWRSRTNSPTRYEQEKCECGTRSFACATRCHQASGLGNRNAGRRRKRDDHPHPRARICVSPQPSPVPANQLCQEFFRTDLTHTPGAAAVAPQARYVFFPKPSPIFHLSESCAPRIMNMLNLNYLLSFLPPLLRWSQDSDENDEKDHAGAHSHSGSEDRDRGEVSRSGLDGKPKTKPHVLLLRSPAEDGYCGSDKYEDAFKARGYTAVNVPVLETVYKNIDKLQGVVCRGGAAYAGVVVTSGRACGAWRLAVRQLAEGAARPGTGMSLGHPCHTGEYVC